MNNKVNKNNEGAANDLTPQLTLVSRLAFLTGLVAIIVLVILVSYLSGANGETYEKIFKSHWLTHERFGTAMWIAGLILLSLVAFITGLISVYSSFRVAGPLYRFSQNFSITSDSQLRLGLRRNDALQGLSRSLLESIEVIDKHKIKLAELIDTAQTCLDSGDKDGYAATVKTIQAHISRVSI